MTITRYSKTPAGGGILEERNKQTSCSLGKVKQQHSLKICYLCYHVARYINQWLKQLKILPPIQLLETMIF
jgi:hypothetical protein